MTFRILNQRHFLDYFHHFPSFTFRCHVSACCCSVCCIGEKEALHTNILTIQDKQKNREREMDVTLRVDSRLMEEAKTGIAILKTEMIGSRTVFTVRSANTSFCSLFSLDRECITGSDLQEVFPSGADKLSDWFEKHVVQNREAVSEQTHYCTLYGK